MLLGLSTITCWTTKKTAVKRNMNKITRLAEAFCSPSEEDFYKEKTLFSPLLKFDYCNKYFKFLSPRDFTVFC